MPRPSCSAQQIENRRRQALELIDKGHSINEVGRMLGCSPSSVMRWRNARDIGGADWNKVRFSPGRPPKLGSSDRLNLIRMLRKGAKANGYATDQWSTDRVAELIRHKFNIDYHRDHIGRLMHKLGWSYPKEGGDWIQVSP